MTDKAPLYLKYYLAGPMTGWPDFNYPKFAKATKKLREQGYDITAPNELFEETAETRGEKSPAFYLRRCISALMQCNAIILLPAWQSSRGTRLEVNLSMDLGIVMCYFDPDAMTYPYRMP